MELRHLRYFVAVAEELHFGRAASRLHIESSPLSRAIKDLESELDVRLFDRDTRRTQLTSAGVLFLEEARRVIVTFEQARTRIRAVSRGTSGILRIGYSEGLAQPLLVELIARFRNDEPGIDVRIAEMPFAEQAKSLRVGLLDIGLAMSEFAGEEVVTEPLWYDPIVVVLPVNHPFVQKRSLTLADVVTQPLVLCHPQSGSGCFGQIDNLLRNAIRQPRVAEYAATTAASLTLVASGYGLGFMGAAEAAMFQRRDIVVRPLSGRRSILTTYLMLAKTEPTVAGTRFINRLHALRCADR